MSRRRARPVVLFVDEDGWNCFLQVAAALRRVGARPVCLQVGGGRRRAALARVGYGTVLSGRRPRDLERLRRLADEGRIVDVHVNELNLARLDPASACRVALVRALGPDGEERLGLLDKLAVSERLTAAGVPAAPAFRLDGATGGAVPGDSYPLLVKQRVSSGGAGVVPADDPGALAAAIRTLTATAGAGTPTPPVFAERRLQGDVVQYAALPGADGEGPEVCLLVHKSAVDPFGPSIGVETIDDPALLELGRRAVATLGCRGLVNLEFVRDPDGRAWHIDLSWRAYGNIASLSAAGVDMIGAYLRFLGLAAPAAGGVAVVAGRSLGVFPTSLLERKHRLGLRHALHTLPREARPYLRAFGARYLLAIALVVLDSRLRTRTRRPGTSPPSELGQA